VLSRAFNDKSRRAEQWGSYCFCHAFTKAVTDLRAKARIAVVVAGAPQSCPLQAVQHKRASAV
jgi:GMP synthase-like glutamine amidotransferase